MNQRITWMGVLTACGLLAVLLVSIIFIPRWLYPPLSAVDLRGIASAQVRIQLQQAQSQLANDARASVLQGLAGLLLIVGAVATWRQVHISREGQITERFTRAVDQLGSNNVDVHIGGIYALERIAKNSPADRNAIQYLLGAFVRNHARWPVGAPDGPEHPTATVDQHLPWLSIRAPDIAAAVGVLGRRPPSPDARVLYLSRTDLRGLELEGAELTGIQMRHTNLARARLREVRLDGSDLVDTDLRGADLEHTCLSGADLTGAHLQDADLRHTDLSYAVLRGADLTGAILDGTILTGAQADTTTTWPVHVNAGRRRELGIIEVDHEGPDQIPAVKP